MEKAIIKQMDPRLKAYCDPNGPEVFHAVAHRQDIWIEDPFDVEHIHLEAREEYFRLVDQALESDQMKSGRILLLKGEAGSGKTHLMRAFRSYLHKNGYGYFGYMQMSTMTDNYSRYMLRNLLESLDKPYWGSASPLTGMMRLSNALVEGPQLKRMIERCGAKGQLLVPKLRDGDLQPDRVNKFVQFISGYLVRDQTLQKVDIDVISALLYLQPGDQVLKNYALKYLNAQGLSSTQQHHLGGIAPRTAEEDALDLLEQLARVMWATHRNIMVLCLDQLEDIYNMDQADLRFRRSMSAVMAFIDKIPSSVVVISCLGDFYTQMCGNLAQTVKDRIEKDPEPIELEAKRNTNDVQDLIKPRLRHYFEVFDIPTNDQESLYPFKSADLDKLAGLRTRDVLDHCRIHRRKAVQYQQLPEPPFGPSTPPPPPLIDMQNLQQEWNDHLRNGEFQTPEDDLSQARLLCDALKCSGEETDPPVSVNTNSNGTTIEVLFGSKRLLIALCNRSAKGGALSRQLEQVATIAGERQLVLIRTTDWPNNPRTQIAQYLGELLAKGAQRAVIEESDWRTMMAYPIFSERHKERPEFSTWRRTDRPLTTLPGMRAILDLSERTTNVNKPSIQPEGDPALKATLNEEPAKKNIDKSPVIPLSGKIILGRSEDRSFQMVEIQPNELTRHAAFLGATGSGKSTIAMVLVEQLLLSGVPALLIDRKGDLCCYADPNFWRHTASSEASEVRRRKLQECLDVALYTPGDPRGRGLSITIVPEGISELSSIEREQINGFAATALCQMMGYNLSTAKPKSLHAILKCTIDVLSQLVSADKVTLDEIVRMLVEQDPLLLNAVGRLDVRLFNKLINDLETLRLGKGRLLESKAERLNIDRLLGLGEYHRPGRISLSIINTKFIGDEQDILFWVATLLIELGRWIGRHPKNDLQAVVMLDEADLYLPAIKKPATKEPMENLLRRARSAGLGILLASQNPGDFDYKCRDNIRTWFLGLIKENQSLNKMRPMLKEFGENISARLPRQSIGQFHLAREGKIERLKGERSAIDLQQLPEDNILSLAQTRCFSVEPYKIHN